MLHTYVEAGGSQELLAFLFSGEFLMFYNALFKDAEAFCERYECPLSFSYWALLQCVSTIVGGKVRLSIGSESVPLNLYVILCGNPAVRAGQALRMSHTFLDDIGYENYLPDNLGLRKTSGLLVAMMRKSGNTDSITDDDLVDVSEALNVTTGKRKDAKDCAAFFGDKTTSVSSGNSDSLVPALQAKAYVSNDFVSFCSGAQSDFYGLLQAMWEGRKYSLSSPKGLLRVDNPYLNIFTHMTQVGLMDTFPDTYVGLNALAHFIVVFEEKARCRCPYPGMINSEAYRKIAQHLMAVQDINVSVRISSAAQVLGEKLYNTAGTFEEDSRLYAYGELRQTHLHRVAACLALYENRIFVSEQDMLDANEILSMAEARLSDALGEFGNSKISAGRQKCLDLLRREEVMRKSVYRARCASFLYTKDFEIFLTDMLVQKKIVEEWNNGVNDYMVAYNPNWRKKNGGTLDGIDFSDSSTFSGSSSDAGTGVTA